MKPKNNSIYTAWSLAIVLCILLSIFVLLFVSCSKGGDSGENGAPAVSASPAPGAQDGSGETAPDGQGGTPSNGDGQLQQPGAEDGQGGSTPAPAVTQAPEQIPTRLEQTEDAGSEYIDKFVFLGDSTTYGLKAYAVLSGGKNTTQVWTPASGTLTLSYQSIATIVYPETGEELKIVDAVTKKQPEYMLITLGVNGVSFMDQEYFTSEYTALVKSIQAASPNTKIILNSIYPVASSYKYLSDINNTKIVQANGWIEGIAADTGVRFLDTYDAIVGSDGWLPEQYQNGDGLHLNADGFNVILDFIRTHEYK